MKKLAIIISMFFALNLVSTLFQSCCKPREPFIYKLTSLTSDFKRIASIDSARYVTETYFSDSNGISYDSLGIELNHVVEISQTPVIQNYMFGITSSYACDDVPDFYDAIKEIEIISTEDYNENLLAGDNLIEVIDIHYGNSLNIVLLGTNNNGSNNVIGLNQFLVLFLTFNSAPDIVKKHDFTIRYKLIDSEEIYETTLLNVIIKN